MISSHMGVYASLCQSRALRLLQKQTLTGISSAQAAGYAMRISCATPLLGSAMGMAGIGFSSILAGEASRRFGAHLRGAQPHRSTQMIARDMALDALLGMSLYKVRCNQPSAWPPTGVPIIPRRATALAWEIGCMCCWA